MIHIKRFSEYLDEASGDVSPREPGRFVNEVSAGRMLNDLAEHIERLEQRFEEHRHNFPTGYDHNGHETTEQTFPPVSTD